MPEALSQLDVFYGDLTPHRAYVYARLPRIDEPGEWSLGGTVRGPRCLHAQTLPTLSRLIDLGPGPTLLAQAVITEPVFWTPDLPAIYDVAIKLLRGTETIATAQSEVGLRGLGVRGRNLFLEGKPYVPRGISVTSTTATLPRDWHEASAMYFTDDTSLEPLAEASQWGAMALVERTAATDPAVRLRELSRYPAVAIVTAKGELSPDFNKNTAAPNILLAQVIEPGQPVVTAPWADILLTDYQDSASLGQLFGQVNKPLFIRRQLPGPFELSDARAACDVLQRETATIGQFAGYLV